MPELSTETKQYHRGRIRSLIVQNPHISAEGIRRHLDKQGLTLDREYIGKHVKAIMVERTKRADTWTLNLALASFQDAMGEIGSVGWETPWHRLSCSRSGPRIRSVMTAILRFADQRPHGRPARASGAPSRHRWAQE